MTFYEKVKESADFIQSRISRTPTIGIILGSGLGKPGGHHGGQDGDPL